MIQPSYVHLKYLQKLAPYVNEFIIYSNFGNDASQHCLREFNILLCLKCIFICKIVCYNVRKLSPNKHFNLFELEKLRNSIQNREKTKFHYGQKFKNFFKRNCIYLNNIGEHCAYNHRNWSCLTLFFMFKIIILFWLLFYCKHSTVTRTTTIKIYYYVTRDHPSCLVKWPALNRKDCCNFFFHCGMVWMR